MNNHRIYSMSWASIYRAYVTKVTKKDRSVDELNTVITWMTGYSDAELLRMNADESVTMRAFYEDAPSLNDNRHLITGSICGVKIQEIEDPLMKEIRYMDKLVDELAKGKKMEKVLRNA